MGNTLTAGTLINRYEIISVLRRSDITTVYLARENPRGEKRLLKEIAPPFTTEEDMEVFSGNFHKICQQLVTMDHRSLHKLEHYFTDDEGCFYQVQKYVEGRYLHEFLEDSFRTHLKEEQVKSWAILICDAIEYLHSQNPPICMGIVPPGSISVSPLGTIRIMDLGLARFFPRDMQREILMKGSPGYVAPEIFEHNTQVGVQSDIYSLGILFHYFLSGVNPNENPFHPPDLGKLRPDLSENTVRVLTQALDPDPESRFKSVREFRDSLVNEKLDRQRSKVDCDAAEIVYADVSAGTLIQGEFKIANRGKGCLEGSIQTEFNWLKLQPQKIFSNQETVRYLIDTTYMQPEQVHENTITIQTAFERIEIPVRITVSPGFLRSLEASTASILMLVLPVLYFGLAELLRFFIVKVAWDQVLIKYNALTHSFEFVSGSREFLMRKMTFEPGVLLYNKLYAIVLILMPYLVPLLIGKMQGKLRPQVQKNSVTASVAAMLLPTILLLVFLYLNFVPMEIASNPMMKHLDPAQYLSFFIPANLIAILLMAAPKDYNNRSFIDRNLFLKVLLYTLMVLYFAIAGYLMVLQ